MFVITLLVVIGAATMRLASDKNNSASQAASWQESLYAAEAGVDIARVALKNARNNPSSSPAPWSGWSNSDNTTFPKTLNVTFAQVTNNSWIAADSTRPWGASTVIEVSKPTAASSINGSGSTDTCYKIRSYGTVGVSGGKPRVTDGSIEGNLRRVMWVTDPRRDPQLSQEGSGARTLLASGTQNPHVTRMVEALVRPITPFQAAIISEDKIEIKKKGSKVMVVDSFNSKLGKYDASKRGTTWSGTAPNIANSGYNGTLATNGKRKDVIRLENINVYGDIYKNTGGTVNMKSTATVSGATHDGFYMDLAQTASPNGDVVNWASPTLVTNLKPGCKNQSITASSNPAAPARYKFTNFHLHDKDILNIKSDNSNKDSWVEIWVPCSMKLHKNGKVDIDKGVHVKFFVERCVHIESKDKTNSPLVYDGSTANESTFVNVSNAGDAKNKYYAEFYGVLADKKKKSHFKIKGPISGLFDAPRHEFEIKVTDPADIYGAFIGRKFKIQGVASIHYDEGASSGPVNDYAIASWTEDWFDAKSVTK